jgi:hypothetical protein
MAVTVPLMTAERDGAERLILLSREMSGEIIVSPAYFWEKRVREVTELGTSGCFRRGLYRIQIYKWLTAGGSLT